MNTRAQRHLSLENRLREALRLETLEVHYQPRCDTQTLEIVGVEALARWNDPEEGPIPPEEFVAVAEECGIIAQIDEWVLETACSEVMRWGHDTPSSLHLAVNLSPAHFMRRDFHNVIAQILSRTGFPGAQLELEITENLVGRYVPEVNRIFDLLVAMNIEIAVDDFGTGYSSLSRLKQLPIHTLKIDQSFVHDLGKDTDDETIVRTIIDIAHNLNLKVVAEGVFNEDQYQFVRENHCDMVQGFLFGKPMTGEAMRRRLKKQNLARSSDKPVH